MENYFTRLNTINVNEHVEKKNGLSYLSWAWAWGKLKELYPDATYTIYDNAQGWNYHTDGRTAWVKTGVTVEGVVEVIADDAAADARADLRGCGFLGILVAGEGCEEAALGHFASEDAFQGFNDLLHVRMGHQGEAEAIAAVVHELKMARAETDFIGAHAAIGFHVSGAEHAVHVRILGMDAHLAQRALAASTVGVKDGNRIKRIFHMRSPHTYSGAPGIKRTRRT